MLVEEMNDFCVALGLKKNYSKGFKVFKGREVFFFDWGGGDSAEC